jgi:hypothetical protein
MLDAEVPQTGDTSGNHQQPFSNNEPLRGEQLRTFIVSEGVAVRDCELWRSVHSEITL